MNDWRDWLNDFADRWLLPICIGLLLFTIGEFVGAVNFAVPGLCN